MSHQNIEGGKNSLYAIPSSVIHPWLSEAIKEKMFFKPSLYQSEGAQLENRDAVASADLSFNYTLFETFHHHLKNKSVYIHASIGATSYKFFRDPFGRLEQVARFLQTHHTNVQYRYYRKSPFPFRDSRLEGIKSLVEFFIHIQRKDSVPIFVLPFPSESDWQAALEIRRLAKGILEATQPMESSSLKKHLDGIGYWFSLIPDSIESLDERWMIVKTDDLEFVLTSESFKAELTPKIRADLTKIKALLKTFLIT